MQVILASNARGQLTTVVAGESAAAEPKVASAVCQYLCPTGVDPLVLLHPQLHAAHIANLEANPQASLSTGHLNPPGTIQRIRAAGWLPPRITLLGKLQRLPRSEVCPSSAAAAMLPSAHWHKGWGSAAVLILPATAAASAVLKIYETGIKRMRSVFPNAPHPPPPLPTCR